MFEFYTAMLLSLFINAAHAAAAVFSHLCILRSHFPPLAPLLLPAPNPRSPFHFLWFASALPGPDQVVRVVPSGGRERLKCKRPSRLFGKYGKRGRFIGENCRGGSTRPTLVTSVIQMKCRRFSTGPEFKSPVIKKKNVHLKSLSVRVFF